MAGHFSLTAKTFKYWEIFLSWIFKYRSRCYALMPHIEYQVYENPSKNLYHFSRSYRGQLGSKGIICSFTTHLKDIEQTSMLLRHIYHEIEHPQLCEWATAEVMAKVMAYRNLKVGHTFPFPLMNREGQMEMTTYVVDRVFELWNGVKAFGLLRSDLGRGAPLLLFRGTDFCFTREGGRASIISDLDPKGPGRSLFEKGEPYIREWLKGRKERARVMGHSLGGVVAAYTLIYENEWISREKHECSYAFNFPGVSEELVQIWTAMKDRPQFLGFVCRGDLIPKFGKLIGPLYEVSIEKPLSPIRAHETLIFAEARTYLHPIDIAVENNSDSRLFYSKIQQQTSSVIYDFGLKFLFPN